MPVFDYLIVGAGLTGCVLAERIANDSKASVLIIDQRTHLGGLCYSYKDFRTGTEIPMYGTHVFHTSSRVIWDYIRRFGSFDNYVHQAQAVHAGRIFPLPLNLEAINLFYGTAFTSAEAESFIRLEASKERIGNARNLEEEALGILGRRLYEAFIEPYTLKQTGKHPRQLRPGVIGSRLGIRFDSERNYYPRSRWQGLPKEGYGALFRRMVTSPRIDVELNCDFFSRRREFLIRKQILYTAAIDRFFDFSSGRLEMRSMEFSRLYKQKRACPSAAVTTFPDPDVPYCRVHVPYYLHKNGDAGNEAVVLTEAYGPFRKSDVSFPVNTADNLSMRRKYQVRARAEQKTEFCGRLAGYPYYDMDETIAAALRCYDRIKRR